MINLFCIFIEKWKQNDDANLVPPPPKYVVYVEEVPQGIIAKPSTLSILSNLYYKVEGVESLSILLCVDQYCAIDS